jgi:voltage-gated potassium channel
MPWRHLLLLISILLLFIVSPLVVPFRHGILFLNIFGAGFLVAGSYALSEHRRPFIIAIVLSIISVITTSLLLAYREHWAVLLSHSSIIILISFFSVTILGYVLGSGRVTADKIFAAICVYLLLGYGWTFIYALLDELQPGSFLNLVPHGKDFAGRVMQLRYFSYMTLTTVGYGDSPSGFASRPHHGCPRSDHGTDLSGCADRAPRWFAHCPRPRVAKSRRLKHPNCAFRPSAA